MYIIKLSQNKYSLIDNEDFDKISKYKWSYDKYAFRVDWSGNKPKKILLHRFIMDVPKNMEIDHINRDKLDNRKSNLRIVTKQQNSLNRNKPKFKITAEKVSIYKGVSWISNKKRIKRWRSYISFKGKHYFIGLFKEEKDAALAYNKKAIELHGNFAKLNIIK